MLEVSCGRSRRACGVRLLCTTARARDTRQARSMALHTHRGHGSVHRELEQCTAEALRRRGTQKFQMAGASLLKHLSRILPT